MKRYLQFKYIGTMLLALCMHAAVAQNVKVDPTFNPDDIGLQVGVGFSGNVNDAVYLPDGKIIVVGVFTSYNGVTRERIARLNADGTLDASFDTSIGATGAAVQRVKLLPDGKLLIAGQFTTYKGVTVNGIARLNSDGTIDASFTSGASTGTFIFSMIVLPDEKIIIAGAFTTYGGVARSGIARLNSNGTLDTAFDPGSGANPANISAVEVQPDGKILIGGSFTQYNGTARNRVARLDGNGSLDATFGVGTGANGAVSLIKHLADGKILIGGTFSTYNSVSASRMARLNSDGTRDASFTATFDSGVSGILIQNDGKYLVSGSFTQVNGTSRSRIARLETDGSVNGGLNPVGLHNAAAIVVANSDESKFLVMGSALKSYNGRFVGGLVQIHFDGTVDDSFVGTLSLKGFDGFVLSVFVQPDGKILVGGSFSGYNGESANRFVRINPDGSRDVTFNIGGGFTGNAVSEIIIDANGKILVAGSFATYNGVARSGIARLNNDGSLDVTFAPGSGVSSVSCMALQADGKILIGGAFTSYNGVARNRIARINADGTLDNSFNPAGPDGNVSAILVQPDNKILLAGGFSNVNGVTKHKVARLNADGTLDMGFEQNAITTSSPVPVTLGLQSDGKIIFGGSSLPISRINSDGSFDNTFVVTSGDVEEVKVLNDDKILVIGSFGTGIRKLNADGSIDNFNLGGNIATMRCFALNNEGDVYIGGGFTVIAGVGRNRFARLNVLKPLTISGLTVNPKVYDGNAAMTLAGTPVLNGIDVDDAGNVALDASGVIATRVNKDVGIGAAVTVTGYEITGSAAHKYGLLQPTGLFGEISQKPLTFTGLTGANNKVYNESTHATILGTPVPVGVVAGDNVVVQNLTAHFDTKDVGTAKTVTVDNFFAIGADRLNYTVAEGITFTADITPKPLQVEIIAQNKVYDGLAEASLDTAMLVGLLDSDVNVVILDEDAIVAEFNNKNVGDNKDVAASNFVLLGQGKDNYSVGNVTAHSTGNISKKMILVEADDKTRPYGQANPAMTITYTSLVDGDAIADIDEAPTATVDASATLTANAGTTHSITLSGGQDNNYDFQLTNGTLEISKAAATINLQIGNATYDGTAKSASATVVPAGLATVITYNGSLTEPVNAGSYVIVATVDNLNYEGSAEATFLIEKAVAVINMTDASTTYDGAVKTVEVTTTPANLSKIVTYKKDGVEVANAVNAGVYAVEALINDANYQSAEVTKVLTINKATATVNFTGLTATYNGSTKAVTVTTAPAGVISIISYRQNGVVVNPVNAGVYEAQAVVSDANYQGSATEIFTINKATQIITYTAVPDRFTTDNPFEITASASSGLPVAVSVVSGPATYQGGLISLSGAIGTVVLKIDQPGNANYEAALSVNDSFEVIEDPVLSTEQSLEKAVQLYPVPAKSKMTIDVSNADYGLDMVKIYDLAGTTLKTIRMNGETSIDVAVDEYPAGTILVEINTTNHERIIKRIVVLK